MTQPSYVPVVEADQVRPSYRLKTPASWRPDRPADLRAPSDGRRREFGVPGPDQGYALLLAEKLFADKVQLSEGENLHDAIEGCAAVGAARSAIFGRAPVAKDVELALTLFGFFEGAPADLKKWRKDLFLSAAHDYADRLDIVARVPDETLRMKVDDVRSKLADWRSLVDASTDR